MRFITGLACDACGVPLPGENKDEVAHCDSCLIAPRPWAQGRAALLYEGMARRLVLSLKHGDRQDLVIPMARWMAKKSRDLAAENAVIAPVPLHWWRMFRRRYNQSALLAKRIAGERGFDFCPDLLLRNQRAGWNVTRAKI